MDGVSHNLFSTIMHITRLRFAAVALTGEFKQIESTRSMEVVLSGPCSRRSHSKTRLRLPSSPRLFAGRTMSELSVLKEWHARKYTKPIIEFFKCRPDDAKWGTAAITTHWHAKLSECELFSCYDQRFHERRRLCDYYGPVKCYYSSHEGYSSTCMDYL